MSSEYPIFDQSLAAGPFFWPSTENRTAPRSISRTSASRSSRAAILARLLTGATASLYILPRLPSQMATTDPTILPVSAVINASSLLSRRRIILCRSSVSVGKVPEIHYSSSAEAASSRRPSRMLTSPATGHPPLREHLVLSYSPCWQKLLVARTSASRQCRASPRGEGGEARGWSGC